VATLHSRCGHYILQLWFLSSSSSCFFFLSSHILSGWRLDVYHTSTPYVALVRTWNAGLKGAARGSLEIQDAKMTPKNHHLRTTAQLCRAMFSPLRHELTIGKKLVKQQYLLQMSPQYGKLRPTNGWDQLASLGHSTQQISTGLASWLCYCSDGTHRRPTKLCTIFRRLLGWYSIYTFSGALAPAPWQNFCQVQNSFSVQVLHSLILAALLHGTPAAGVSQTLWRCTRQELWTFRRVRHLYLAGRPSCWASAHILVDKVLW